MKAQPHNAHVRCWVSRRLTDLHEYIHYLALKPEYGGYRGTDYLEKMKKAQEELRLMEGRWLR